MPRHSMNINLATILFFSLLGAGLRAGEADKPPAPPAAEPAPPVDLSTLPELELLVTSKFTPKEAKDTQANFLAILRREAFACFANLKPQYCAEPVKDGGARYRFVLEHTGTLQVAAQITSERTTVASQGGGGWFRNFYLDCQQSGTLTIKLLKWNGTKYEDVMKATVPMPKNDDPNNGRVQVGRTSGLTGDDQKCPVSIEMAQKSAFLSFLPGNVRDVIFGKLVTLTAAGFKSVPVPPNAGGGNAISAELTIKNSSCWSIKKIQTLVSTGASIFAPSTDPLANQGPMPFINLPEPLLPGQTAKVKVEGRELKAMKPGFQLVEFVQPPPPPPAP